MEAISISGLTVKYKDLVAVDNVSFSVKRGEIFGIIGPNGAGKTSALECIEGLRKAKEGEITVFGQKIRSRPEFYSKVGVQLQETRLQDNMRVSEIIDLYKSFYPVSADGDELLERFDLAQKKKSAIKRLSGGQRQKLAIILALIGNPEILILDEISTGLDPHARLQIWEKIRELKAGGKTILMTTHFMEEAEQLCDRVCLLADGRIKAIGTLPEMIEQADLPIVITVSAAEEELNKLKIPAAPKGAAIEKCGGTMTVRFRQPEMLSDLIKWICISARIDDISISKPRLEDVFFKLTGASLEDKK